MPWPGWPGKLEPNRLWITPQPYRIFLPGRAAQPATKYSTITQEHTRRHESLRTDATKTLQHLSHTCPRRMLRLIFTYRLTNLGQLSRRLVQFGMMFLLACHTWPTLGRRWLRMHVNHSRKNLGVFFRVTSEYFRFGKISPDFDPIRPSLRRVR